MKNSEQDSKLIESSFNRRAFVKGAGFTGLGLAGATMVAGKLGANVPGASLLGFKPSSVLAAGITDLDILNFALNLEYLEAEFYTMATVGKRIADDGIPISGSGTPGPTTGGKMVNLMFSYGAGNVRDDFNEITYDEQQHVLDLRAAITAGGGTPVAKPAINLDALGIGFHSYSDFFALSRAFEDTGVSAYGGAAPLITNKDYLSAAVRIGLTEAYHASNVRLLIAAANIPVTALDSMDVLPPPSGRNYFTVDQKAMAIVRTTSEVLAIVYHNSTPGTMKGGFFPNGVNGTINTV